MSHFTVPSLPFLGDSDCRAAHSELQTCSSETWGWHPEGLAPSLFTDYVIILASANTVGADGNIIEHISCISTVGVPCKKRGEEIYRNCALTRRESRTCWTLEVIIVQQFWCLLNRCAASFFLCFFLIVLVILFFSRQCKCCFNCHVIVW